MLHAQSVSVCSLHTFQHSTTLHAHCTHKFAISALLPHFTTCTSLSKKKINLHMHYASLGNRRPQELLSRMHTEINKEIVFIFFSTETWRHVMEIY